MKTRGSRGFAVCAALVTLSACGTSAPMAPSEPKAFEPGQPPLATGITIESVTPSPGATLSLSEDCARPGSSSIVPCTDAFHAVVSIVSPRDVSNSQVWLTFLSPTAGCNAIGFVESGVITAGVPTAVRVPGLSFPLEGSYEPPDEPPVCLLPTTTTGGVYVSLYERSVGQVIFKTYSNYPYTLTRP